MLFRISPTYVKKHPDWEDHLTDTDPRPEVLTKLREKNKDYPNSIATHPDHPIEYSALEWPLVIHFASVVFLVGLVFAWGYCLACRSLGESLGNKRATFAFCLSLFAAFFTIWFAFRFSYNVGTKAVCYGGVKASVESAGRQYILNDVPFAVLVLAFSVFLFWDAIERIVRNLNLKTALVTIPTWLGGLFAILASWNSEIVRNLFSLERFNPMNWTAWLIGFAAITLVLKGRVRNLTRN